MSGEDSDDMESFSVQSAETILVDTLDRCVLTEKL